MTTIALFSVAHENDNANTNRLTYSENLYMPGFN